MSQWVKLCECHKKEISTNSLLPFFPLVQYHEPYSSTDPGMHINNMECTKETPSNVDTEDTCRWGILLELRTKYKENI